MHAFAPCACTAVPACGAAQRLQCWHARDVYNKTRLTYRHHACARAGHGATIHACTVEDGSLVGMGAVLLDGVTVRHFYNACWSVVLPYFVTSRTAWPTLLTSTASDAAPGNEALGLSHSAAQVQKGALVAGGAVVTPGKTVRHPSPYQGPRFPV